VHACAEDHARVRYLNLEARDVRSTRRDDSAKDRDKSIPDIEGLTGLLLGPEDNDSRTRKVVVGEPAVVEIVPFFPRRDEGRCPCQIDRRSVGEAAVT